MADEVFTREVVSITHTNISDGDREVSSRFNRVAQIALIRAEQLLMYGSEQAQAGIIRAFAGASARLASLDSKTEIDTQRAAFTELMGEMTKIDEAIPVVAADSIGELHGAPPASFVQTTDN
jgi:hypothetical protein